MTGKGIATLEVLAVSGIIALTTAAVAPLVSTSEQQNTLKCAANGRKIMAGLQQYMADHDGRFPSDISSHTEQAYIEVVRYLSSITWNYTWGGVPRTWDAGMGRWRYLHLKRYVKDDSAWVCPAAPGLYNKRYAYGFRQSWLARSADDFVNGDRGFYKVTSVPWPSDRNHTGSVGLTIADVEALDARNATICGPRHMPPHRKIMIMCYSLGRWAKGMGGPTPPWNQITWPQYAHGDGTLFGYADGHVEWKRMGMGWAPIGYTKLDIDQHQ
jgi:prepilin-type processing-associated H-X9-DG protein